MVRVQRVIETIHTTESTRAPSRLYVKAYQADIERLREADRCSEENIFLHMQYLVADMHIAELALVDIGESKGVSLSGRLEDLHYCVEALKALCRATPFGHVAAAMPSTRRPDLLGLRKYHGSQRRSFINGLL